MFGIHLKTALGYIRRSPFQALAASFVLILTFFVATIVSVLVYSSSQLISYFETRPQIIAFLKDGVSDADVAALEHTLQSDSRIKDVKYVSKEEALAIYQRATSDNPLLGQLVSPSIFPASLEFSVTDLSYAESVINQVKADKIVDSVGFTAALGGESSLNDVVKRLNTITFYVKVGGIAFVSMLAITSLVVLLIIISMRMASKREEMEILTLIGATRGFISSPIIMEAVIYAILGVVVGWLISFILILYSAPTIVSYFGEVPVLPSGILGLSKLFGIILVVELFFGLFLAFAGSLLAIGRVKKAR